MKIAHKLAHLFFPRESNNHKAKILHSTSLSLIILVLVFYQFVLNLLPKVNPNILGFAANISPSEVIRLTNEKRMQAGLSSLEENSLLSQAALAKGTDMLNKGYWAHTAPDGTQPWKFFTEVGYKYRYAGENLARDFSNPSSAVEAWMASPSHKENVLSAKYKEIGIAVVEGKLNGVDTTIIVQLFGTKYSDSLPIVPVAQAQSVQTQAPIINQEKESTVTKIASPIPTSSAVYHSASQAQNEELPVGKSRILISPFKTTKSVSLVTVGVLLGILVIDGIVTSRKRIVRIGGRTFAHVSFLGMILTIIIILKAGKVI